MLDMTRQETKRPYRTFRYGKENNIILVFDHAMDDLEIFTQQAWSQPFEKDDTNLYPGVRSDTPTHYKKMLLALLAGPMRDVFEIPLDARIQCDQSVFSLTAQPEETLRPIQCIPHIDSPHNNQFAVVHYLAKGQFGGTGFYKHVKTGLESITPDKVEHYFKTVKQEAIKEGKNLIKYMNGSNALFEQIADVPFMYNRLIVYQCNCLHAGNLDPRRDLSNNPTLGRLTANSLLSYSRPHSTKAS